MGTIHFNYDSKISHPACCDMAKLRGRLAHRLKSYMVPRLTGQTPHGVLISPVEGIKGTNALKSFFCSVDVDLLELLSATSVISALPSNTKVFKMVSISPSDS